MGPIVPDSWVHCRSNLPHCPSHSNLNDCPSYAKLPPGAAGPWDHVNRRPSPVTRQAFHRAKWAKYHTEQYHALYRIERIFATAIGSFSISHIGVVMISPHAAVIRISENRCSGPHLADSTVWVQYHSRGHQGGCPDVLAMASCLYLSMVPASHGVVCLCVLCWYHRRLWSNGLSSLAPKIFDSLTGLTQLYVQTWARRTT